MPPDGLDAGPDGEALEVDGRDAEELGAVLRGVCGDTDAEGALVRLDAGCAGVSVAVFGAQAAAAQTSAARASRAVLARVDIVVLLPLDRLGDRVEQLGDRVEQVGDGAIRSVIGSPRCSHEARGPRKPAPGPSQS